MKSVFILFAGLALIYEGSAAGFFLLGLSLVVALDA